MLGTKFNSHKLDRSGQKWTNVYIEIISAYTHFFLTILLKIAIFAPKTEKTTNYA